MCQKACKDGIEARNQPRGSEGCQEACKNGIGAMNQPKGSRICSDGKERKEKKERKNIHNFGHPKCSINANGKLILMGEGVYGRKSQQSL